MTSKRLIGAFLVLLFGQAAHASLIGDTVEVDSGGAIPFPPSAVVGDGVEFEFSVDFGAASADVEYDFGPESLWITYELFAAEQVQLISLAHTVTFTDLDWFDDMGNPVNGEIVGFNLVSGSAPELNDFGFGPDSLFLDWDDISVTNGTRTIMLHFDILVEHRTPEIPEPATMMLFGIGSAGLALARRRFV